MNYFFFNLYDSFFLFDHFFYISFLFNPNMSGVAARVLLNYSELPTITWSRKGKNLLQLLSVEPNYGVGKRVVSTSVKKFIRF
jgi:hypothetical protein